jgi:hypothetical protein
MPARQDADGSEIPLTCFRLSVGLCRVLVLSEVGDRSIQVRSRDGKPLLRVLAGFGFCSEVVVGEPSQVCIGVHTEEHLGAPPLKQIAHPLYEQMVGDLWIRRCPGFSWGNQRTPSTAPVPQVGIST